MEGGGGQDPRAAGGCWARGAGGCFAGSESGTSGGITGAADSRTLKSLHCPALTACHPTIAQQCHAVQSKPNHSNTTRMPLPLPTPPTPLPTTPPPCFPPAGSWHHPPVAAAPLAVGVATGLPARPGGCWDRRRNSRGKCTAQQQLHGQRPVAATRRAAATPPRYSSLPTCLYLPVPCPTPHPFCTALQLEQQVWHPGGAALPQPQAAGGGHPVRVGAGVVPGQERGQAAGTMGWLQGGEQDPAAADSQLPSNPSPALGWGKTSLSPPPSTSPAALWLML